MTTPKMKTWMMKLMTKLMTPFAMTTFAIKIIAISAMLIDHAGAVFDLHIMTRIIGRAAFPLFVYLIACGCRHTKSLEKYLLRLGAFAIISEIPFDLAFNERIDFFNDTNIFYTLWLGVACVYVYRELQKVRNIPALLVSVLPVYAAMMAADWVSSDFGPMGVLFIFLTAISNGHKHLQLGIMSGFMFLLYFANINMMIAAFAAVIIAALANGERGPPVKWFFYLIYPGHLLILALLAFVL